MNRSWITIRVRYSKMVSEVFGDGVVAVIAGKEHRRLVLLRQQLVNMWRPRHGEDWRTPGTAFLGHLAMLSNRYAGSGGDALPYYFKAYELGPVIGTRTWGGLVGISRNIPLLDGGNVTFPEFGFYSLDGEWVVENYGVDPDIVVQNLPHELIAGRDPQLEKAVELILERIEADPIEIQRPRKFPERD